jgi:hypothetical protein
MKATFKLNGVKVVKELPTRWAETSFRDFKKLTKCGTDRAKILAALTGLEEETLRGSDIANLETLIRIISYVTNEPFDYTLPKVIQGYPIADNLEVTSLDRYNDLEDIIKSFGDDNYENISKYPLICAIYAVNPYNYKTAESLSEHFLNAPCTEVMAVGNFTLVNISGLRNIMPQIVQLEGSPLSRLRRAMRNYLKYLVYTVRYYSWRKALPDPVKRYINGQSESSSTTSGT